MKINMTPGRIIVGRLKKGEDLLGGLERICAEEGIKLGEVTALGAVKGARIGYYDQDKRQYFYLEFKEHLEILALVGNVSLKDGKPFVHAHVTFGNEKGEAVGGHLAEGAEVFACEYSIREYLSAAALERAHDEATGLFLWK
ncbi:MAG: PPC domain-containing DNA-binding protein [Syntrophobacteraceae bacterium]